MTPQPKRSPETFSMTAAKTARIAFEDSVNAYTGSLILLVEHVVGQEGQGGTSYTAGAFNPTTEKQSVRRYQLRNNRFGVTSALLRLNVTAIDSASSLSINSWIESA